MHKKIIIRKTITIFNAIEWAYKSRVVLSCHLNAEQNQMKALRN